MFNSTYASMSSLSRIERAQLEAEIRIDVAERFGRQALARAEAAARVPLAFNKGQGKPYRALEKSSRSVPSILSPRHAAPELCHAPAMAEIAAPTEVAST